MHEECSREHDYYCCFCYYYIFIIQIRERTSADGKEVLMVIANAAVTQPVTEQTYFSVEKQIKKFVFHCTVWLCFHSALQVVVIEAEQTVDNLIVYMKHEVFISKERVHKSFVVLIVITIKYLSFRQYSARQAIAVM